MLGSLLGGLNSVGGELSLQALNRRLFLVAFLHFIPRGLNPERQENRAENQPTFEKDSKPGDRFAV